MTAERVLHRLAEQDRAGVEAQAAAAAPVKMQVAGRAVLLIPHRGDSDEIALPDDYHKILAIVRAADGPVQVGVVDEELGRGGVAREAGAAAGEDDQARRSWLAAQAARRRVHRTPGTRAGAITVGA
ncbi:hypothetical protein AB0945_29560 [Streptomyces sp. NPDC005474]|uniref:hypothetical protein n=1 Tax=Streptomyces sp. NPDC005474 TaxID=3154878 RepID=UPI003452391E